ncbi:hypothetical protein [Neotabrizicola shimadae]|uniref:Peptidase C-terminal archaeal/bacterial domain-containing protein n=1 Tax=Neotabrizicola shimadae TaxID=2807096 RepID=A0A8G0ZY00_9RHOB|nr:hypothetical protein [Neotabrizicola shimadae]QYZ71555.1 hypothetical protein JO391_08695 [Neotabrizicola shimadae]
MLKTVSVAALCLSVALPALAEDKKQNVMVGASGTPGAVSQMELAQQLYAVGVANADALTVLTAAKLAAGVELKDTDRKKETKGDAPAEDAEGGAEAPVDAAAMLAKAKELAGEDETLVGLVEDAEAEGSRGRIGGASSTLSRLPAGMTDVWEIPFYGESYAEIGVLGDGDSNLDVLVTDENGNTICYDVSWSDKVYCDFTPAWNGYFYVTVQNTGSVRNSYYLMTN